jgi:hypothetical protein
VISRQEGKSRKGVPPAKTMSDCIDFSSVTALSEMTGDSDADTELLKEMAAEARAFILAFDWCMSIQDAYFGCGIGGVVGVFFFRIVPALEEVDDSVWVVVGDIPPAYLVADESRTPGEALRNYIDAMREWVVAAESGRYVEDLIPVNVPPNREMALALKKRLDFLEREVVPSCR